MANATPKDPHVEVFPGTIKGVWFVRLEGANHSKLMTSDGKTRAHAIRLAQRIVDATGLDGFVVDASNRGKVTRTLRPQFVVDIVPEYQP